MEIALLSARAWGGLGKTCHLPRVWAINWLRLGVLGLSLQVLSLEGVAGLEALQWTRSSPRPQNTDPSWSSFSVEQDMGSVAPKALQ